MFALGDGGEFIVVDVSGFFIHAVLYEVVEFAGEVGRVAMGEVAAVCEVHAENFVAGLEHGGVDGKVGLGSGVGLHVGVFGAEELLGPLDGEDLDFVHFFASAIPTFAGVALGVFVGQDAALSLHHRWISEVL